MAVDRYPNTSEGRATVAALPGPCHVWVHGDEILVLTGDDIQPPSVDADLITPQQFRDRFSPEETLAILAAEMAGDVFIASLVWQVSTAEPFAASDPRVRAGLDYLVAKGLLTPSRAAGLLAGF